MAMISTFSDTFPASIDAKWTATNGTWDASGRALLSVSDSVPYPQMYTAARWDARDGHLAAKLTPASGMDTSLRLTLDSANYVCVFITGTSLRLRTRTASVNSDVVVTAPYSAVNHAYVRLHDLTDTRTILDVSPDGTNWTSVAAATRSWSVANVLVTFAAGQWSAGQTGSAYLDNINQPGYDIVAPAQPPSVIINRPKLIKAGELTQLSCYASDPDSVPTTTWTQLAGPTVALTTAGDNRTFIAPSVATETQLTFRASVTDTINTVEKDVSFTVLPSGMSLRTAGGSWMAIRRR